jgi:hypothetical protein
VNVFFGQPALRSGFTVPSTVDRGTKSAPARPASLKSSNACLRTAASGVSGLLDRQKRDRDGRKRCGSRSGRRSLDRRTIAAAVDLERRPVRFYIVVLEWHSRQRIAPAFEWHLDRYLGPRVIDDKKRHASGRAPQAMGIDMPPLRDLEAGIQNRRSHQPAPQQRGPVIGSGL